MSSCSVYTFFRIFRYMCTLDDKDASTHLMRNVCVPRGRTSKSQLQTNNKLNSSKKKSVQNCFKHLFSFRLFETMSNCHHALFLCWGLTRCNIHCFLVLSFSHFNLSALLFYTKPRQFQNMLFSRKYNLPLVPHAYCRAACVLDTRPRSLASQGEKVVHLYIIWNGISKTPGHTKNRYKFNIDKGVVIPDENSLIGFG